MQIEFFDDVDEATRQRTLGALAPAGQPASPMAQPPQQSAPPQVSPMAGALMQFAQQFAEPPISVPIPVAPGNTFGLKPQDLQQVYGNISQTNQFNAETKLRQRVEREKAMEAEKDRAQAFKLEETREKNNTAYLERQYKNSLALDDRERRKGKVVWQDGIPYLDYEDENGMKKIDRIPGKFGSTQETKSTYDSGLGQVITWDDQGATAITPQGLAERPDEPSNTGGQWYRMPDGAAKFARPGETIPPGATPWGSDSGADSAPHYSTKYINWNAETGQQEQWMVMSDGTKQLLGTAPPGYAFQTDAQGNVVGVHKNNPQDTQTVPAPGPLPQGQAPLQTDLPAGTSTEAQRRADWSQAMADAEKNDPNWYDYKTEEERFAATQRYMERRDRALGLTQQRSQQQGGGQGLPAGVPPGSVPGVVNGQKVWKAPDGTFWAE